MLSRRLSPCSTAGHTLHDSPRLTSSTCSRRLQRRGPRRWHVCCSTATAPDKKADWRQKAKPIKPGGKYPAKQFCRQVHHASIHHPVQPHTAGGIAARCKAHHEVTACVSSSCVCRYVVSAVSAACATPTTYTMSRTHARFLGRACRGQSSWRSKCTAAAGVECQKPASESGFTNVLGPCHVAHNRGTETCCQAFASARQCIQSDMRMCHWQGSRQ
jgi:hypothetical protein